MNLLKGFFTANLIWSSNDGKREIIMVFKFNIYQTGSEYAFMSWENAREKFNLNDYAKVYSGTIEDKDISHALQRLYFIFNLNHPVDYKGRSLSVSDIVELKTEQLHELYYCNPFGWIKL